MGRKLIFSINIILVLVTLVICGLTYIAPSKQGILLGVTLLLPGLLVINFIFFVFWLVKLDKRVLLSLAFLVMAFPFFNRIFNVKIKSPKKKEYTSENKISIASFNVLHYNNQEFETESLNNCFSLFEKEKVDLFGLQEANKKIKKYPFINSNNIKGHFSQSWIYTKHKMLNSEVLNISFGKHSKRRSITCADVIMNKDTLRMYNLHFESYRFPKKATELHKKGITNFRGKIKKVFKIHENEVNELILHIKESPYPVIVMGDFNNNSFSYEYTQLIKQCALKDTFVAAGNGFGATFDFKYFPTRIDFILVPKTAKVYSHDVIKVKNWSDHYPIITEISL